MFNYAQAAVSLPTIGGGQDLPAFISSIYSFTLTVVGVAVFIQIVRAGFMWLTAAGNVGKAAGAKSMMTNAVIGAILLFAAYMILFVINPDLVKNTFNFTIPSSTGPTVNEIQKPALVTSPTGGPAYIQGVIRSGSASSEGIKQANATAGIYIFAIRAVDTQGNFCERSYSMEVLPTASAQKTKKQNNLSEKDGVYLSLRPKDVLAQDGCNAIRITTESIPDGIEGQFYFAQILAAGGNPPFVYSISDGQLPNGLGLSSVISNLATLAISKSAEPSIMEETGGSFPLANGGGDLIVSDDEAFQLTNEFCTEEQRQAILAEREACEQQLNGLGLTPPDVTGFYGQAYFDIRNLPECTETTEGGTLCYNVRTAAPPNTPDQSCDQWLKYPVTQCNFTDPWAAVACGLMYPVSGEKATTDGYSYCIPGSTCGQEGCLQ